MCVDGEGPLWSVFDINTARWLVDHFKLGAEQDIEIPLIRACERDDTVFVQWLVTHFKPQSRFGTSFYSVRQACMNRNLTLAQWLTTYFNLTAQNSACADIDEEGISSGIFGDGLLWTACAHGDLATVQWVVQHFNLTINNVRSDGTYALVTACENNKDSGPLIARWLTEHFSLEADDDRRALFYTALAHDDLGMMQWFVSRFGYTIDNIRAVGWIIRNAICEGLVIAQWFVSHFELTKRDISAHNNRALRDACERGRLETVQWLVDRFGITADEIRADNNLMLRLARGNGHMATVRWLVTRVSVARTAPPNRICQKAKPIR
jgi:hypothetical protein